MSRSSRAHAILGVHLATTDACCMSTAAETLLIIIIYELHFFCASWFGRSFITINDFYIHIKDTICFPQVCQRRCLWSPSA